MNSHIAINFLNILTKALFYGILLCYMYTKKYAKIPIKVAYSTITTAHYNSLLFSGQLSV